MGQVISLMEWKRERRIPDRIGEILDLVDKESAGTNKKSTKLMRLLDAIKKDPALAAASLNDHVWNG